MTRVDIVDFDSRDDPASISCPAVEDVSSVLLMPIPRWVGPSEVNRRANLLDEQWRVSPRLVVCRVHPSRYEEFRNNRAITEHLVGRFPTAAVALLSWTDDYEWHLLSERTGFDADANPALLRCLAHAELSVLLEQPAVVLPATEEFHYVGPSGRHYDEFVRVGTAIQAVDALDSIAFWLLPELSRSPAVVLDSWTILSLGLNTIRYLGDNPVAGPDGDDAAVTVVETRRSYEEPAARLETRLAGIRDDLGGEEPPPVLVLVSVSGTGNTARALEKVCRDAGFPDVTVICLYGPQDADRDRTLCVLPDLSPNWRREDCPRCAERSAEIRVMPDTYMLDLAAYVHDDAIIRITDAVFARRFLRQYAGAEAITVHRNQHDDERHHMIDVDIIPLLDHEAFLAGLGNELAEVGEIDLIVCPEHDAAQHFAELVSEQLGVPVLAADPARLLELTDVERTLLHGSRRVLIVDDVVITGTRLRNYRVLLHREGLAIEHDFEFHVLAGVARPPDLSRLKSVMEMAHFEQRFHFVELLPLPYWGEEECPWCDEQTLLTRYGSRAPQDSRLAERDRRLRNLRTGLGDGLFLPWLEDGAEVTDPMLLGPGSIFLAETEAELFAAVASSLQVMRNNNVLTERLTLPLARVLAHDFAFHGRYYDTVITACLLRATRRHDLRAPKVDPELERLADERLREAPVFGLHGELLFALQRGHLPGGSILAERSGVFEQSGADASVSAILRQALRGAQALVSS